MKLLIVGSGGREHALAWTVARQGAGRRVLVAPGNAGSAREPGCDNVELPASDIPALRDAARAANVALTIVGPEGPLAGGIVDEFQAAGLAVFGPTRDAARLESSKAFAKEFMLDNGIPTARARTFTEYHSALRYLATLDALPVIKVSGLAAGKGVYVPDSADEAEQALYEIWEEQRFGAAGQRVVVEERLRGPELSVLAFCDGEHFSLMPAAQDHKRLLEGDQGPNTGGMGAFAPSRLATSTLLEEIGQRVFAPTLAAMARRGTPYVGVLYAGLMLTAEGAKVLEFNCRFGDPEAQVILPLLDGDLVEVCEACVAGELPRAEPRWREGAAATVVLASGGYPGRYETGFPIEGIARADALPNTKVFHAGTMSSEGETLTDGGRVLSVSAWDDSLAGAIQRAYAGTDQISFAGLTLRRDIGRPALQP